MNMNELLPDSLFEQVDESVVSRMRFKTVPENFRESLAQWLWDHAIFPMMSVESWKRLRKILAATRLGRSSANHPKVVRII